jgi:PASTA domain
MNRSRLFAAVIFANAVLGSAAAAEMIGIPRRVERRELRDGRLPLATVPDLVGQTVEESVNRLRQARLRLGRVTPRDSEARAGTVVAQEPARATEVKPSTPVSVVIARPRRAERVQVPPLFDRDMRDASELLTGRQLRLGVVRERESDEVRPGTVVDQNPPPDMWVDLGTEVNIVIARQRIPERVRVPNVGGTGKRTRPRIPGELIGAALIAIVAYLSTLPAPPPVTVSLAACQRLELQQVHFRVSGGSEAEVLLRTVRSMGTQTIETTDSSDRGTSHG